jgi:hypothetical protein
MISGAIKQAMDEFVTLDVKHVLVDTLSYIILDDTIRMGLIESALNICGLCHQFHDDNKKQTPEYIARAFNHGSYSKVK